MHDTKWNVPVQPQDEENPYNIIPMQLISIFHGSMHENIIMKICGMFFISGPNIDFWCSLEPPQWGGSNEPQKSMFGPEIRKQMYIILNPFFHI